MIDISNWKDFLLSDLFDIELANGDIQAQRQEEGKYPLVSSGKINNGICKFIQETSESNLFPENIITVDMFGKAFFQPNKFYAVSHGRINILKPKNFVLSEKTGLFFASIIERKTQYYTFNEMCSSTSLSKEILKLPVKENFIDFSYIESFTNKLNKDNSNKVNNLNSIILEKKNVDISNWCSFKIGDLFPNFVKPSVLHTREVEENEYGIPYVVRTKFNNGIKYRVTKTDNMNPSPAGVISFGSENATFFYQEEEFVSGRDIYYIDTRQYSKEVCFFILTCLQTITHRYSYNYGMFPELVKEEHIKLPVNSQAEPDWKYMEDFIKQLFKEKKNDFENLMKIV